MKRMNELEEVKEIIKDFIFERKQVKEQISEIEEKRNQLAEKRNEMKKAYANNCMAEISVLGKQIAKLGIQSQELQNKLDFKFYETKKQINLMTNNLIAERIRKIRIIEIEREELESKILLQKERSTKYELQKQEFLERFGRIPELSENAINENKHQEEESLINKKRIQEITDKKEEIIEGIAEITKVRQAFKNKNYISFATENSSGIEENEEDAVMLPLTIEEVEEIPEQKIQVEEIVIEEFTPIEELNVEELEVEEFGPIEEIKIEEFTSIEELEIEEFGSIEEIEIEDIQVEEINPIKEFKVFGIVEDEEQDINQIHEEEIIPFRGYKVSEKSEENIIKKDIEERVSLSSIIAKIENGEIVYKAQTTDGEEINIYPTKTIIGNQILRNKEKKEELKEILIKYSIRERKILDQKVINKIDPTICEILVIFANRYNYDVQNLIYNYAMSFSRYENYNTDNLPIIVYNLSYLSSAYLSKKEKSIIKKICKDARKNYSVDIIGYNTKFNSFKYLFKRIFAIGNHNALPEGVIK